MRNRSIAGARFFPGSGLRLAAAALASVLLLSGCAPGEKPSRDASATARLDQATGQILTPISEYDLTDSDADTELLNHAVRIWMAGCMSKAGYSYSATIAKTGISDDRDFGIWFEPNARVYGWGFPPNTIDDALNQDAIAGGQSWKKAEQTCGNEDRGDPVLKKILPTQTEETDSLLPNLKTEAYRLASSDPTWQRAREDWWKCLRTAGLEPLTGAQDWNSAQTKQILDESGDPPTADQLEKQIVLASTEARCNNETRLTQRLGNLLASYQAPLIAKNQAALNKLKTEKQARLDMARSYIAQNG